MRTSCVVRAHTICPILIIIISAAAAAAITDDKSADEEVEDEKRTESHSYDVAGPGPLECSSRISWTCHVRTYTTSLIDYYYYDS